MSAGRGSVLAARQVNDNAGPANLTTQGSVFLPEALLINMEGRVHAGQAVRADGLDGRPALRPRQGVSADLWNYDPDPVWSGAGFWVAVSVDGGSRWIQVGWWMDGADTQSRVFLQYKKNDGTLVDRWYHSDDTWKTTSSGAVNPTAAKKYEVFRSSGTWYVRYDFGSQFTDTST